MRPNSTSDLPSVAVVIWPGTEIDQNQTIQSLSSQCVRPFRIISLCNASTKSAARSAVEQIIVEGNATRAQWLSQFLKVLDAELAVFLEPGQCLNRRALAFAGAAYQQFADASLVYGWVGSKEFHEPRVQPEQPLTHCFHPDELDAGSDPLLRSLVFFPSTLLRTCSVPEEVNAAIDWELARQIARHGPVVCIPDALASTPACHKQSQRLRERAEEIRRRLRDESPSGRHPSNAHPFQHQIFVPTQSVFAQPECSETNLSVTIIAPVCRDDRLWQNTRESIEVQSGMHRHVHLLTPLSVTVSVGPDDTTLSWRQSQHEDFIDGINRVLADCATDLVMLLPAGDRLTPGALHEAAKVFEDDPAVDAVLGDALLVNGAGEGALCGLPPEVSAVLQANAPQSPEYGSDTFCLSSSAIVFRRSLCQDQRLDRSLPHTADIEFLWRILNNAQIRRLDQLLALVWTTDRGGRLWSRTAFAELYSWSRKRVDKLGRTIRYRFALRATADHLLPRYQQQPWSIRYWWDALRLFTAIRFGFDNPELRRPVSASHLEQQSAPLRWLSSHLAVNRLLRPQSVTESLFAPVVDRQVRYVVEDRHPQFSAYFCSYAWPRQPGVNGGEIRDFHLIRGLLKSSNLTFFGLSTHPDARPDFLGPYLDAFHTPESIRAQHPELVDLQSYGESFQRRLADDLRKFELPVLGRRYHADASYFTHAMVSMLRQYLNEMFRSSPPDFFFVSPQTNAIVQFLETDALPTRFVLASYDVEAIRMQRFADSAGGIRKLAAKLEVGRARRFERDQLRCYDGVIAVSPLDKQRFEQLYGVESERILVVDNGVDPEQFQFVPRPHTDAERPIVVYVGNLYYEPNRVAALRLAKRIHPLLLQRHPDLLTVIVGQGPGPELMELSDGRHLLVTGRVEDVRPYWNAAAAACLPLLAGSGTKLKMLEALSSGTPVVGTPIAAEGLELELGQHYLSATTDAELVDAVDAVISDRELARRLSDAGRRLVVQRYSWDRLLEPLPEWMEMLKQLPRRSQSRASSDPYIREHLGPPHSEHGIVARVYHHVRERWGREPSSPYRRSFVARRQLQQLLDAGIERIALFGAGAHTEQILPVLTEFSPNIVCILDDRRQGELASIPIVPPSQAQDHRVEAVLLSTDSAEEQLWHRRETFLKSGIRVIRLYGPGQ